jgi:hypothetical protein
MALVILFIGNYPHESSILLYCTITFNYRKPATNAFSVRGHPVSEFSPKKIRRWYMKREAVRVRGIGAWIVGHATEVKVTLIGLTPICSISNIVRKGKQLLSKWMEHNAEYSVGQVQAPLSEDIQYQSSPQRKSEDGT